MPQVQFAAPDVAHDLNVRTAVDVDQHGVFFCGVEIRGLDDGCIQLGAIVRRDFDKFYRRQAVVCEFGDFIFVDGCHLTAVYAVEILSRRGGGV